MKARRRIGVGIAALAAAALVVAGCGTPDSTTNSAGGSGTGKAASGRTFAVVTHGGAGDAFWNVVKKGAEQAGKDLGVTVQYQSTGDPVGQANMINAAVAAKVDGIVVSMANPDALGDSIKKAVAAGIPVITINSGAAKSVEFGGLVHVGQDETIAGEGAGRKLGAAGVKKLLCIKHEAAHKGLDDRCNGVAATLGGTVETLQVDGKNLTAAQTTITAKLQQDKSIDGVLALDPGVGHATVAAAVAAGSSAKIATFDLNADVIDDIIANKIMFAVDQQQYLQGYLPIVLLNLYVANASTVGGGKPVLTGPGYVTRENASTVKSLTAQGTR